MVKISKKRITPEEEIERFAERIWLDYGDGIEDIDSYNVAFNEFFNLQVGSKPTQRQDENLRKEVFKVIKEKHPSVVSEHLYRGRGKPKKTESFEDKRKKPKFIYLGYFHNKKRNIIKKTFVRKQTITYLTKKKGEKIFTERQKVIYRDRLGRFCSIKSKLKKNNKVF